MNLNVEKMITIEKNGRERKSAEGFSWKLLLFGCLYPAFKGDFKGFVVQFILSIITLGLNWFIAPFYYNRNYIDRMVSKGWKVKK